MDRSTRQLIDAYLDGELTPEMEERLVRWIEADKANMHAFVRETHMHRVVRDTVMAEKSIQEDSDLLKLVSAVEPIPPGRRGTGFPHREPEISPRTWRIAWSSVAAAGVLLVAGVFFLVNRQINSRQHLAEHGLPSPSPEQIARAATPNPETFPAAPPAAPPVASDAPAAPDATDAPTPDRASRAAEPIAQSEAAAGPRAVARIVRPIAGMTIVRGKQSLDARAGMTIYDTDTVVTRGFQLFDSEAKATADPQKKPLPGAAVRFNGDASTIVLGKGTEARFFSENGARRVEMFHGEAFCEVAPQHAKRPMLLLTPYAKVTVLGTRFTLKSDKEISRLDLHEGRVRFADRESGEGVETQAGQFAVIDTEGQIATGSRTVYEAEDAQLFGAVAARNWKDFTGTGFVDFLHAQGDYVEWSIHVKQAGRYKLTFRYGNMRSLAKSKFKNPQRPLDILVNGVTTDFEVPFAPTDTWEDWRTRDVVVTLQAGTNTVRALAVESSGPNLDHLTVSALP